MITRDGVGGTVAHAARTRRAAAARAASLAAPRRGRIDLRVNKALCVSTCANVRRKPETTCQWHRVCVRRFKWPHQRPSAALLAQQARRARHGALARRKEGLERRWRELSIEQPSRLPRLRAAGLRRLRRLRRRSAALLHALHWRGWHLRDARRSGNLTCRCYLPSQLVVGIVAAARTHLIRSARAGNRVAGGRWRRRSVSSARRRGVPACDGRQCFQWLLVATCKHRHRAAARAAPPPPLGRPRTAGLRLNLPLPVVARHRDRLAVAERKSPPLLRLFQPLGLRAGVPGQSNVPARRAARARAPRGAQRRCLAPPQCQWAVFGCRRPAPRAAPPLLAVCCARLGHQGPPPPGQEAAAARRAAALSNVVLPRLRHCTETPAAQGAPNAHPGGDGWGVAHAARGCAGGGARRRTRSTRRAWCVQFGTGRR